MKNGLYLAFIYLSSLIGAGFASGQELSVFFLSHGKGGYCALLFAGLLFGLLGSRLFTTMGEEGTHSLTDFLAPRIGRHGALAAEILSQGFILSTFIVMISAGSTLLEDTFAMPRIAGALLTFFLCILPPLAGGKGLLLMGTLLVPFMILAVLIISGGTLLTFRLPLHFEVTDSASPFYSALLFVSYNTLTLIPITAPFSGRMNRKSAFWGGTLTGLILLLLLFLSGSAISSYPASRTAEMPMLFLANRLGSGAGWIYFFMMLASIISTAGTGAFGIMNRFFPASRGGRLGAAALLGLLSLPLSLLGFSELLSLFYPFFGLLGLCLFPIYCIK